MWRKSVLIFLAIGFVFVMIGTSPAVEKGNERKGKYLFRKNCRSCHQEGQTAASLNPNTKTQAQWERAFERFERFECADEWKELSEPERGDIFAYLYNHAFDSPSPATCE